jgi:hypothetical protein
MGFGVKCPAIKYPRPPAPSEMHETIRHAEPVCGDKVRSGHVRCRQPPIGAVRACWTDRAIAEFTECSEFAEKRFRSYCELCWLNQTQAAALWLPPAWRFGEATGALTIHRLQHGESAESTVPTEEALCFLREH